MDNKLIARTAMCSGASWSCLPHSGRCLFASGARVVVDVPAVVGVVAVVVRLGAVGGVGADAVPSLGTDVLPTVGPVGRAVAVVGVGADAVLGVVVGAVFEAVVGKSICAGGPIFVIVRITGVRGTSLARRTRTHKGVGLLRTGA